jgi:S-DNA-T family DNA segregation ATPase FtsK/SpoIIIE
LPGSRPGSPTRGGTSSSRPGSLPGSRSGSPSRSGSIPGGIGGRSAPPAGGKPGSPTARPSRPTTQTLGAATTKKKKKAPTTTKKPDEILSLDTKLDILGVGFIIIALITLLSFLSRSPGVLIRAWLRVLFQGFGWGAYLVPVGIGAAGVWLIWRHFGDRIPLDPIRISGAILAFVALLTLIHASVAATQPIGSVVYIDPQLTDPSQPGYTPDLVWEKAIACPVRPQELLNNGWVLTTAYLGTYDIARCGQGGGYVGAFIVVTLNNLLGGAAVFLIAIVAAAAGLMMAARKSLQDVADFSKERAKTFQDKRKARAAVKATAQKDDGKEAEEKAEEDQADDKGKKETAAKPAPTAVPGRPSIVTGQGPGGTQPAPATASPAPAPPPTTAPPAAPAVAAAERRASPTPTPTPTPRPQPGPQPGDPNRLTVPPRPGQSPRTDREARPLPGSSAGRPGAAPAPTTGTPSAAASPGRLPGGKPPSAAPSPAAAGGDGTPAADEEEGSQGSEPDSSPSQDGQAGRAAEKTGAAPPTPPGRPDRPGPRAREGRTFGPIPPSVIGGSAARPVPKPGSAPAADAAADKPKDEAQDVVFDDLASAGPDPLDDAIALDDEMPPTDQIIKELVEEDRAPRRADKPNQPPPGAGSSASETAALALGAGRPPQAGPRLTPARAEEAPRPAAKPASQAGPTTMPKAASPPKLETKKDDDKPAWKLPRLEDMLENATGEAISDEELRQRAEIIEQTLSSFGAPGRVVEVNQGPVITQFGVEPDYVDSRAGKRIKVKVGKISALADDLALSLAAPSIRIEAPVPGKGFVGIEVPNAEPSNVGLRDVMDTPEFRKLNSPLKLALGQNVSGMPVVADLTAMPHLLIAGTTGSGKSVCVNGIISTMLMTCTPDMLKVIMVDPKRVELTNYNGIPHLMAPVVTELERIVGVLKWVQREMDDRYRTFAMAGARNITDYNERLKRGLISDGKHLPYMLVIVDELADLMMLAPDETERLITRLAQMARATGIHIILSTQRPSVDVVTGLIKANFPARIAFAVATGVDSRVILDTPGAEKLLGRGDMLFQAPDAPLPVRMQGVFVSDREIQKLVDYWREQGSKTGAAASISLSASGRTLSGRSPDGEDIQGTQTPLFDPGDGDGDALFDEAVELVRDMGKASISLLQRHLRIGYARAARLIDLMEERDVIGPHEGGSKPREVLGPDGSPLNGDQDD